MTQYANTYYGKDNRKKCKDHLGNDYSSKTERAKAYNLANNVVQTRLAIGWSLERALTTPLCRNKD